MDWVFDINAWSTLKAYLGLGGSPSSSSSETLLLPKAKKQKTFNLEQISEHVFELSTKPESPSAEIIFFHGLQLDSSGKAYITTWLSKDGTELWLNWLLKEFPDVRILVVRYDASAVKTDGHGRLDMYLTCENLVQELMRKRKGSLGETGCPIILVGHCLGGLVLKELCVQVAHLVMTEEDDCFKNFFRSVKGVFCYSSPHHGSELPDCNTPYARGSLFKDFNPLNATTVRRNEHFRKLRNKSNWKSEGVGESLEVNLSNFKGLIVPEGSSRHDMDKYYTINADHFDVCRPESTKSTNYIMLAELVDQVIKKDKGSVVSESDLPDILVGLDSRTEAVQDKLCTESRIAIVGMWGIGKTTLARAVYERIQKSFDYACFYGEVKSSVGPKETAQKLRDKIKTLFVDRRGQKVNEKFRWKELRGKKVLIVLDDTISEEQVKVMTTKDRFSTQSRLIITARDKGFIVRANLGFYIHPVEELDFNSSKELFCRCAFGEESPVLFAENVKKIVTKCGGLPLALTITGKYLFSKRKPEWEDAFERLQAAEALNGDAKDGLWSLLRISYESLAHKEKEMFLDAATCFHGKLLEEVREVWKVCDWADHTGWGNLLEKHLVKERRNRWGQVQISMHEVLRDLGRSMAQCSRMSVPELNEVSNEEAKVVKVISGHVDDFNESFLHKFSKLKVLWLDAEYSTIRSGRSDDNDDDVEDNQGQWMDPVSSMFMDSSVLTQMLVIRVSEIKDVALLKRIFTMKSLRFLMFGSLMKDSNFLTTLWAKIGNLQRLKALHIDTCSFLHQIPVEIGKLHNLQLLHISFCYSLETIPAEIGQLKNLQSLAICWCSKVEAIPREIGQLMNLQWLDFSNCQSLMAVPAEIGQLKNLQSLYFSYCRSLNAIPVEIGQLENLESLGISHCSKVEAITSKIGQLKNLQSLDICYCDNLEAIPVEIGQLKNLQLLTIYECSKVMIPTQIGQLKNLQSLGIRYCDELEAIPIEIGQLKNLQSLTIYQCPKVKAIPAEIGQLTNLQSVDFHACKSLKAIPAKIGQLKNLQSLDVGACSSLEAVPVEIGQLENLQSLDFLGCSSLKAIPSEIGQLKNLQSLNVHACFSLEAIPAEIGQLENLQSLDFSWCKSLKAIPAEIGQLKNLQSLDVRGCSNLEAIPTIIGQLENLQLLDVSFCDKLEVIPAELSQLQRLLTLECDAKILIPKEMRELKNLQIIQRSRWA